MRQQMKNKSLTRIHGISSIVRKVSTTVGGGPLL